MEEEEEEGRAHVGEREGEWINGEMSSVIQLDGLT